MLLDILPAISSIKTQSSKACIFSFVQWLSKHPQFFSNPFYVTGDSYSGMIVPALVQEISKGMFFFMIN